MKLADYLLNTLHETFMDNVDEGEFDDDSAESFEQYLSERGFNDLARYHLADPEELEDKLNDIQEILQKREANERKHEKHEAEKKLTNVADLMLHELGQAAKKSKQDVAFNGAGLTNMTLEFAIGRNAVYLTLRDKDDNVVAESSYKMSRNSIGSRYYDFDRDAFTSWKTIPVDEADQDFESGDVEYDTKKFLEQYINDGKDGEIDLDENEHKDEILRSFSKGFFDPVEESFETEETTPRRGNQDWESKVVKPASEDEDDLDDDDKDDDYYANDEENCEGCDDCDDDDEDNEDGIGHTDDNNGIIF